jgi:uracil-DNA glycosylase
MPPSERAAREPDRDCPLCPRLVDFRLRQRAAFPDWHNAPVPCFGDEHGRLLIVGLAPGLRGANRTGRPFTGDYAGNLLYATLLKFGFARGAYRERPDDGLTLIDCRIANAVRCVPPENKPEPSEINTCHPYLVAEIAAMKNLCVVMALGKIAHDATVRALGGRLAAHVFAHGAVHEFGAIAVADSYHCSRYNTNTGRLTTEMFENAVGRIRKRLD